MPAQKPVRVLIVDDELLGRQRIEDLLRSTTAQIVGTADTGEAAIAAIAQLDPDLVFLDVQMPGKTGLEVVREVGPERMPATIFVTAYDQFALKAFDLAALDYLVKPFDDERFEQAFARAQRQIELREVGRLSSQLLQLLHGVQADEGRASTDGRSRPYLERIAVEMRGQVRVVPVADIDYISASGPYAELHVGDRTHLIRERMQTLEERLDPRMFFRVHRSAIVRLDRIETLLRDPGGDYAVRLKSGVQLSVSRGKIIALETWMGVAQPGSSRTPAKE
jgi:two-component system, LytTR family, response regulator